MREGWNMRRLQLLRELQLRETITAVAAALGYSPSTVSQQLAQLEREVGTALLQPEGRRVRLTANGELIAAHAARVMALEEDVRGRLEPEVTAMTRVRVASIQTVGRAIVPRMLEILAASHPALRVEVAVVPPEHALFELEARGYDLVIAEQYPGHTRERRVGLDRQLLWHDAIRLATAPGDDVRTLADARDRSWIMEPEGTAARAWAVQQCRAAGFEPDVRFEADDLLAHIRFIAAGHAVGMLPGLALVGDEDAVRTLDLPGAPDREIFTTARESSAASPGVRAVRAALREAIAAR